MIKLTWIDNVYDEKVVYDSEALNSHVSWNKFICTLTLQEYEEFLSELPYKAINKEQDKMIREYINDEV